MVGAGEQWTADLGLPIREDWRPWTTDASTAMGGCAHPQHTQATCGVRCDWAGANSFSGRNGADCAAHRLRDLQKTPCNVLLATWRTEQHTTWQHSPGHNCLPRALSVKSFQAIRGHSGATDANRYVTTYASSHADASHNFTFVTVRGAGHMVPQVSAPCRYCMICDVCGGCALCRVPLNMAAST